MWSNEGRQSKNGTRDTGGEGSIKTAQRGSRVAREIGVCVAGVCVVGTDVCARGVTEQTESGEREERKERAESRKSVLVVAELVVVVSVEVG